MTETTWRRRRGLEPEIGGWGGYGYQGGILHMGKIITLIILKVQSPMLP